MTGLTRKQLREIIKNLRYAAKEGMTVKFERDNELAQFGVLLKMGYGTLTLNEAALYAKPKQRHNS